MLYQRSLDIERRLQLVVELICTGKYSTPDIARELGVSIPTISRDVAALRERGHVIVAEQQNGAWRYVLAEPTKNKSRSRDRKLPRRPR